MNKQLICIACPRGCRLTISGTSEKIIIEGNGCKKGIEYGQQEIREPRRMLTTTVRTSNPRFPRLPVRLSEEVPKARLFEYMKEINCLKVSGLCVPGDVLIKNMLNSGVDLVAAGELYDET